MMMYFYPLSIFRAALTAIVVSIGMGGSETGARATGAEPGFEEQGIEFHNEAVKLAGTLLLPRSEVPLPAVVFVHGAGHSTRESLREVGEYFASNGFAVLLYDKRGTGESGGVYESHKPYENLVNDALSAIAFLKQRPEIAPSQIGIWGLSQGAYISAAAAAKSDDIKFIITVGASVADGMMFYYRDNLFRRYGPLPDTLRDVAEKAHLAMSSLPHDLTGKFSLDSFAPRVYPSPGEYVHPAWSHVAPPVLAMWGELDQHVPVGESVAGLKNSLAHARNQQWTVIIQPQANHDLGISETGELHREWRGYSPGALQTMTDWAWSVINHPAEIDKMREEGVAPLADILSELASYESLRWFGNGIVQTVLWITFFIIFLAHTLMGIRRCLVRAPQAASSRQNLSVSLQQLICALNFLILSMFTVTMLLVVDQRHPSCPPILLFLPLLGTISTLATIALLMVLAANRNDRTWTVARRIRVSLEVLCLILFVPFMLYWNLIGYRF